MKTLKDFRAITFEVIDINVNATPDIFINRNGITFSKRVLEDLGYPAHVQYCVSPENRVFSLRSCKSNEAKAVPFSKPKAEQTATLSTSNKNVVESIKALMPDSYDEKKRYKVTGVFDSDSRIMYFDMEEAKEDAFRQVKSE